MTDHFRPDSVITLLRNSHLDRGMPRVLSFQDTETLTAPLGCDAGELRHDALPPPKPWRPGRRGPGSTGPRTAAVAEMEVEAAAGPDAFNDDFVLKKARWRLPEAMIRHEGDADPGALRIIKVRGVSMEPELREGDRLVIDTARRDPAAGELFALWDGTGLVVKRVEPHPEDKALRLHCTNPAWPRYSRPDDDVHIVSARCCGRSPACEPQRPLGAAPTAATRSPLPPRRERDADAVLGGVVRSLPAPRLEPEARARAECKARPDAKRPRAFAFQREPRIGGEHASLSAEPVPVHLYLLDCHGHRSVPLRRQYCQPSRMWAEFQERPRVAALRSGERLD